MQGNYGKTPLLAVVFAALWGSTAVAETNNCAPRDTVVDRLASKFGESRQSMGLGSNNSLVEVFASTDSGTWTITVTMANGLTCLVASGQAFEELTDVLSAKGKDA